MDSCHSWPEPLKWIDVDDNGKFLVQPNAAMLLSQITQPVVVVAVAGLYRTGKSYIMNRMAGRYGFDLGSTVQSKTKGIWIWCLAHPTKPKHTLVLLDTEGLGDPEKFSEQHDMTIFSLAVLLSSTLIFNAIGKIDQEMIDKLHFVTEITDTIKVKSKNENSDEDEGDTLTAFTEYFPDFVLAVRDFTLDLELDGNPCTANEYFNHILKLKKGNTRKINDYNLPREAIRNAFKSHHCFVFTRPVKDEKLFTKLANNDIGEEELNPDFLIQSEEFCNFIFNLSSVKRLKLGQPVNGAVLESICEEYIDAINRGAVPCIESTVVLVAQRQNNQVVQTSLQLYNKQMQDLILPASGEALYAYHNDAYENALDYFRVNCIFDEEGEYFIKITDLLTKAFAEKLSENEATSVTVCTRLIEELYDNIISEKLKGNEYMRTGGFDMYCSDMEVLLDKYASISNKGVKADEVRNNFLKEKEAVRNAILAANSQMSEKEKEISKLENAKKIAEMEAFTKNEEIIAEQERYKALEINHENQLKKIAEEQREQDIAQAKETEIIIDKKMKEQAALLQEGFQRKAGDLEDEIKKLREKKDKIRMVDKLLGVCDKVVDTVQKIVHVRQIWKNTFSAVRGLPQAPPGQPGFNPNPHLNANYQGHESATRFVFVNNPSGSKKENGKDFGLD